MDEATATRRSSLEEHRHPLRAELVSLGGGEPIAPERRDALPWATPCIACKQAGKPS
jgi:hypothetical protein